MKKKPEKKAEKCPEKETAEKAAEPRKESGPSAEAEEEKSDGTEIQEEGKASGNSEKETKREEKKLSETDILKIYLENMAAQLKKTQDERDEIKKELDAANGKIKDLKDSLTSLSGEYENYRRRTGEEKVSISSDAVAKSVSALLPALDSLERAVPFAEKNPDSFRKGVEMTLRLLSDGFKTLGVEEIEADGEGFNPGLHNAVMHVEDENLSEGVVAEVLQKGYKIGDRVIRHSMVKVAN